MFVFTYDAERPFEAGRHRGIELRAPVRAACGGEVLFAGRTPRGLAVTVRCGALRVTHHPLASVAAARGARVRRGARLGRAAARTWQLGARRAGDPFGYVDPSFLLRRRAAPLAPPPAPLPVRARPRPPTGPSQPSAPRGSPRAPWPLYAGCALIALAFSGVGLLALPTSLPRPRWPSTSRPRSST